MLRARSLDDKSVTENTRVALSDQRVSTSRTLFARYLLHRQRKRLSSCPQMHSAYFLSIYLTPEQTQYYFLSGFTAKLAGTERGIIRAYSTFSSLAGQAFLELLRQNMLEGSLEEWRRAVRKPTSLTQDGMELENVSPSKILVVSSMLSL